MSWWQQDTPSGDTANLDRFLSFLTKAEGGEPDIIVGGGRFSDFSQHPRVVGLRTKEGPSTAAGNYQITASTYDDVAPKIGVTGFTPADQRAIAVELIRRKGALEDINGGDFTSAINKLGSTWASLPSSPYSQPKKSWDETNKMLGTQVASAKPSENWWSKDTPVNDAGAQSNWWSGDTPVDAPAAAVGGPQPTPSPVVQAAPRVTPSVVPAPAVNPAAAISTEQPLGERIKRGMSIGTRDVLEGIDKYNPVRAAFDFAGGVAGLVGDKGLPSLFGLPGIPGAAQAREFITNNLGMNAKQTLGSAVSDKAGLAKPETKAEKTVSAAVQGASGLLTGTGLSNVIAKAPQAIQTASSVLLPAVSGTAKQVAGQAALTGGLSASMEVAPAETAAGLALLAAGKAGAGRYATSRGSDKLVTKAGSLEKGLMDAEVIDDLAKAAANPNLRGGDIYAAARNEVANRYVKGVERAATKVDPELMKSLDVKAVLDGKKTVGGDALMKIMGTESGDALVGAINKYQRLLSLTKESHANDSLKALAARGIITATPAAIGGTVGGVPGAILGAMLAPKAEKFAQMATGKASVAENTAKAIKQAPSARLLLEKNGASQATQDISTVLTKARDLEKAAQARNATVAAEKVTQKQVISDAAVASKSLRDANAALGIAPKGSVVSKDMKVTGGVRGNLQVFSKLDDKEVVKGLNIIKTEEPYMGSYIDKVLKNESVPNRDMVLHLTDRLSHMRSQGVLSGATETATKAGAQASGKGNTISKTISNLTDDEVVALAGRSKDTLDVPIANLKGYVTTRASRAMKTYKTAPDKVPAEDVELLRKLGAIQ